MRTNTPPANEYILREKVLNDDTLYVAPFGYRFKGGYVAMIKEYTYQNPWSNKLNVVKFKSANSLSKYIAKNYKDFDLNDVEIN